MNLSFLNPLNWIKSGVTSQVDRTVDELLTAKNLEALGVRVTNVETRMDKMEASLNDGFKSLSISISNLGHDVGERVNLIEKKVVDEKQEWGKSFRKWLDWIVKLLILGCGTAMGVTVWKLIFGN